ncbi:MAG: hypothetical protein KYX69_11320 [Sphingomonas sp.]|uniref:hypothetical protein n=1 Tax=Sphingomonas sp. TaxID=28214 RepID=UPI0026018561|nr:hypothetical protein [Sphingomonas sp.]MDK2768294.1 hypothetical protein [Sphingomonas sp.]
MNREFEIFGKLEAAWAKVLNLAEKDGVREYFSDGCAFTISEIRRLNGGAASFVATCTVCTRGGLRIPVYGEFVESGDRSDLDPHAFALTIYAAARQLINDSLVHEKKKAELKSMIETKLAGARLEGIQLDLVSITELPVLASHPNRDGEIYFDIAISEGGDDGAIDTFHHDAADAEEFGLYVDSKIIAPLKRALAA